MDEATSLTVTILTRDEERNLARCLESVSWAQERLVVDCGSQDATVEIAERAGARVVQRDWAGYVDQRNFALETAAGDWILVLDADEWLTADGADEIRRRLSTSGRGAAFALNRLTAFSGDFIRHAWHPDWTIRLFRKGEARYAGGAVHEGPALEDGVQVERLEVPFLHLGYRTLGEHVERMNRYTDLVVGDLVRSGAPVGPGKLFLSPAARFLKHYVVRKGFLDGWRGFVVSVASAYYVFLKYAKVYARRRGAAADFRDRVPPTAEDPRPWDQS